MAHTFRTMWRLSALLLSVAALATANEVTYTVDTEATETRFIIDELLFGQPKTVVGVTSAVNGAIIREQASEDWLQFTEFQVDARTFVTDDQRRNGAIQRFILESTRDQYRYITFVPSSVSGLPRSPAAGIVRVVIAGTMQIRDVAKPVAFDATIDLSNQARITGNATATVKRSDFGLRIPSVPFVANVSDEVVLEIDFAAEPVG